MAWLRAILGVACAIAPTATARAAASLGDGVNLVPRSETRNTKHCKEERHYFHLTGLKDVSAQKRINILLRSSVEIEEGCDQSHASEDEITQAYLFKREIQELHRVGGSAVVYKVYETSYMGGVHDSYRFRTHVIDLMHGEEINPEKLFKENGREQLAQLGKLKLSQYYKRKNENEWSGDTPQIRANQILPQGDGFQVQFDPYEVDCFAAGAPVIRFTSDEAARIFRPSPLFGTATKRW